MSGKSIGARHVLGRILKEPESQPALRRFKPYPTYKDSGIEWLGKIPVHWDIARISESTTLINGYPFDSAHFVREEGVPLVRIRDLNATGTEVNYTGPIVEDAWIDPCDVIIGMDGDFNVARWRGERALLNQRMCCLRMRDNAAPQFIFYLLPFPLKVINDLTYSTTVKHLSSGDVRKIRFGRPPSPEQRAIAVFLDRETARIDELVAKKEALIALLHEKRTALITRAVTKGLDPNAPMKDSGVGWLGQVPAHWDVKRLKFLLAVPLKYGANEVGEIDDRNLPRYVRITDIDESDGLRDDTFRSLPLEIAQEYLLREGDLLFARSGATVGKTFLFRQSWGQCAYAGYLIRARLDLNRSRPEYLRYFTASASYWHWLTTAFIQATIQNVSAERYANLRAPLPPLDEQWKLTTYLDRRTADIDGLLRRVRDAIERLQELRLAIISAAVTGKIDVRGELA